MPNANDAGAATLAQRLVAEHFATRDADLVVGDRILRELADEFGTPLFVYDGDVMRGIYRRLADTLAGFAEIYFSIKANPNPAVARIFVTEGAGIEIASGGEYLAACAAGAAPDRILFAGPGKGEAELELVIREGIGEIHLETFEEIERIEKIAQRHGKTIPVAIRVNPVAAAQGGAMRMGGRPAPFGFDEEQIGAALAALSQTRQLDLNGVHLFAGTQILDADVLLAQWRHGIGVARDIAAQIGHPLCTIDLGGGLGIPYYSSDAPLALDRIKQHVPELAQMLRADPLLREARVIVEPGRFLAGPAGIYVARILAAKTSRGERFLITDGGMHHHLAASGNLGQVIKRDYPLLAPAHMGVAAHRPCVVTGPLCTPLDTLARKIDLPDLRAGDLIAVLQSGAYGLSASPTGFLSHPTPAEILVENGKAVTIRPRGSFEALAAQPSGL